MRVTYLMPFPELGGGNQVTIRHAELLRTRGHEVTLLGEGPRPDWISFASPYHDRTRGLPALPPQDLVIATYFPTVGVALELALGPVAHFCQGYEGDLPHLAPRLDEIEEAYSHPLPTLTVSPHLAKFLRDRFDREALVVPPIVDPAFRPGWRWRPARPAPWVAVPGIFEAPVKGVPFALEGLRRARSKGSSCRILRFSILPCSEEESNLLPADSYLQGAPPTRIAAELRRCDLLVLGSQPEEGFGLPLLEAMSSGVPAIATRIPSVEFIGGAARMVPYDDPDALASAVIDLLSDTVQWRRARRRGLEAARRFAPDRVGQDLERALLGLQGRLPVIGSS